MWRAQDLGVDLGLGLGLGGDLGLGLGLDLGSGFGGAGRPCRWSSWYRYRYKFYESKDKTLLYQGDLNTSLPGERLNGRVLLGTAFALKALASGKLWQQCAGLHGIAASTAPLAFAARSGPLRLAGGCGAGRGQSQEGGRGRGQGDRGGATKELVVQMIVWSHTLSILSYVHL